MKKYDFMEDNILLYLTYRPITIVRTLKRYGWDFKNYGNIYSKEIKLDDGKVIPALFFAGCDESHVTCALLKTGYEDSYDKFNYVQFVQLKKEEVLKNHLGEEVRYIKQFFEMLDVSFIKKSQLDLLRKEAGNEDEVTSLISNHFFEVLTDCGYVREVRNKEHKIIDIT